MSAPQPLDWNALVIEARRRRARDGLTQIGHANLAGVSATTIRSFDNFERTISVEKASAILKVVGLLADERHAGRAGEDFIAQSLARWKTLAESLPPGDPARLQHGYYYVSYKLVGELSPKLISSSEEWRSILAALPPTSGWPPFYIFSKKAMHAVLTEDDLQLWLGHPAARKEMIFASSDLLDFWRVSTGGELFTLRGYEEDSGDESPPGKFFDIALPAWRVGEVLDHAGLLAGAITQRKLGDIDSVRISAHWTGLSGRVLADWSDPTVGLTRAAHYRCRTEEVRSVAEYKLTDLGPFGHRAEHHFRILQPLYQAFEFNEGAAVKAFIEGRAARLKSQN